MAPPKSTEKEHAATIPQETLSGNHSHLTFSLTIAQGSIYFRREKREGNLKWGDIIPPAGWERWESAHSIHHLPCKLVLFGRN